MLSVYWLCIGAYRSLKLKRRRQCFHGVAFNTKLSCRQINIKCHPLAVSQRQLAGLLEVNHNGAHGVTVLTNFTQPIKGWGHQRDQQSANGQHNQQLYQRKPSLVALDLVLVRVYCGYRRFHLRRPVVRQLPKKQFRSRR